MGNTLVELQQEYSNACDKVDELKEAIQNSEKENIEKLKKDHALAEVMRQKIVDKLIGMGYRCC